MRNRIIPAVVLVLAGLALAGCYDTDPVVQIHKPGKYKGPPDPLVKKMASTQQDEIFANRFKMVQTDR
jgi:type IV pilus biogenesis protein CpaD/CtpE